VRVDERNSIRVRERGVEGIVLEQLLRYDAVRRVEWLIKNSAL
jgi:hypothetical protein